MSAASEWSHISSVPIRCSGRVESSIRMSKPNRSYQANPKSRHAEHLVLDLLLGAEDVRVVLDEVPHAQQAVQRAARLVAVQVAGLGVAQRQLAVGAPVHGVERAVARAVHRLEGQRPVLGLCDEHVLAVLVPVAGDLPQLPVVEQRGLDLGVAALDRHRARARDERVVDGGAGRGPERAAGAELGEVEQPQLAAELAVVVLARLLEALEVRVEVVLRVEGRPVDAGEHRVVGVAAPVRARDGEQLERLDADRSTARAGRGRGR